jgi:hypothetical protein
MATVASDHRIDNIAAEADQLSIVRGKLQRNGRNLQAYFDPRCITGAVLVVRLNGGRSKQSSH